MMTILSSETMDIPDGVKIKVDAKKAEAEAQGLVWLPQNQPRHPHRSLPHRKSHHRHHQGVSLQDPFVYANFSINASITNEVKDNPILDGNEFFSIFLISSWDWLVIPFRSNGETDGFKYLRESFPFVITKIEMRMH
ncbi:unnamed protein product [Malus baccata var. baccata]